MRRLNLSVALCTYNGARFLPEQLESIATQTRLPDELVVCDDRSTDRTVEILQNFAQRAPFPIRIEINEHNLGSTKNFEKAIGNCSGSVIVLADQDDVWLPQKLGVLESIFLEQPSTGLAFSDAEVVDQNKTPLGYRLWNWEGFEPSRRKALLQGQGTQVLLHHNIVTGATMAFRSEFRQHVLPIPENWVQDGWIALMISVFADLAPVGEPLILYRKHSGQQIGPRRVNRDFSERLQVARDTGAAKYCALAEHFSVPLKKLSGLADDPRVRAKIPYFEMKLKHLRARAQMDMERNRIFRVPRILEELVSRRYHLYSEGWVSAAKDLLLVPGNPGGKAPAS